MKTLTLILVCLLATFFIGCSNQTNDTKTEAEEAQELEVGSKAPEFTLADQKGEMHTLADYKGKNVVLYFYPKDDTGG